MYEVVVAVEDEDKKEKFNLYKIKLVKHLKIKTYKTQSI